MPSAREVLAPERERGALFGAQTASEQRFGAPRNGPEGASHAPVTLRYAVLLLAEARKALLNNKDEANRCIAKAAAILQAESDVREMDARNATGPHRHQLAPWQIARVVRFVDDHLAEKMPISSLAVVTRLSSGHFARAFRVTVGESPHAYVIRRRIERAQELILSTGKPLAEIALDCGFGDQAHMTRFFRRIVGVSPSVWRRAHSDTVRDCYETVPGRLPSPRHMLADTNGMGSPAIAA
jgi:AraC-like DNA-binding protein